MDFFKIKSVRYFDSYHKIPKDILGKILAQTFQTVSSFNLQPWRFFIFEGKKSKNNLKPFLYGNQSQLETSSAIVLLCCDVKKQELAEKIYQKEVLEKKISSSTKIAIINKIFNHYNQISKEKLKNELFLEGGIAALQLMFVAKSYGYNVCPIGGFNDEKINSGLNIDIRYLPIILIAIGKSKENLISKSLRLNYSDFTFWM